MVSNFHKVLLFSLWPFRTSFRNVFTYQMLPPECQDWSVICSREFLVGPLWLMAALKWSLPFSAQQCEIIHSGKLRQWFTLHLGAHTIFPTSIFNSLIILNLVRGTVLLWNDLTLQAANFWSVSGVYPAGETLKIQFEAHCLPYTSSIQQLLPQISWVPTVGQA